MARLILVITGSWAQSESRMARCFGSDAFARPGSRLVDRKLTSRAEIDRSAHLLEQVVSTRLQDDEMEPHVRLDTRLEVEPAGRLSDLLHPSKGLFEGGNLRSVGAGSRELRSGRFDDAPQLGELPQEPRMIILIG